MTLEILTRFFMWCSIFNVGIMMIWALFFVFAPDFIYRMQTKWFPISRETYNVVVYGFLGTFKIFIIVFNLAPYVALRMIG